MKAVVAPSREAGLAGLHLVADRPYPHAAENDVVVDVRAAGFTPGELDWPSTWTDRAGRDRSPSVPGHELAGVVAELGYGTTGLTIGQRVFGLSDWARDGTLAEFVAVEARNLAPLPADVDYRVGAALPISGLTAWQALHEHGRLEPGQTLLVNGAAGAVGSIAVQLGHRLGARVIGTGRAKDHATVLELGADEFVDLDSRGIDTAGPVDLVLDVIGGEIGAHSAEVVRPGGTFVTIAAPPTAVGGDYRAVFFVVEPDRTRLAELAGWVRDGTLAAPIGSVHPLADAVAAVTTRQPRGKTIIAVHAEPT